MLEPKCCICTTEIRVSKKYLLLKRTTKDHPGFSMILWLEKTSPPGMMVLHLNNAAVILAPTGQVQGNLSINRK